MKPIHVHHASAMAWHALSMAWHGAKLPISMVIDITFIHSSRQRYSAVAMFFLVHESSVTGESLLTRASIQDSCIISYSVFCLNSIHRRVLKKQVGLLSECLGFQVWKFLILWTFLGVSGTRDTWPDRWTKPFADSFWPWPRHSLRATSC